MFYDAARGNDTQSLPPLPVAFAELEKRLFDTFLRRPSPLRSSLRGSIFRFAGRGYGHTIGIETVMTEAVARAAIYYQLPFDVVLLGLVICAQARAEDVDSIEYTLYAPMRDGASDGGQFFVRNLKDCLKGLGSPPPQS